MDGIHHMTLFLSYVTSRLYLILFSDFRFACVTLLHVPVCVSMYVCALARVHVFQIVQVSNVNMVKCISAILTVV